MEIDLVYLWVNGNDPQWLARRNDFLGITHTIDDINCKGRYANNDELKYSLRSVEKYLPWIRKIFIVTDNQTPQWLNTAHPKIEIINQQDILPSEANPCYNSVVVEYFLHRIPDLSEQFLYANDDMFVNAEVLPSFFFADDGFPYIRLLSKPLAQWRYRWKELTGKKLSTYRTTILKAARLVKARYGKFYSGIPHHNIDAYKKSSYRTVVEDVFKNEIGSCVAHHKRTPDDIQRALFSYYALAIGQGHPVCSTRKKSCVIDLGRPEHMKYISLYHPKLFCLNDTELTSDDDRQRAKAFLENYFPKKSAFEK